MMADTAEKVKADDQDQSMEEILQSIRKIIAEEDDDPKAAEAKPAKAEKAAKKEPEPETPPPAGSDVLELTAMVKDDGSVVDLKAEASKSPEAPAEEEKSTPEEDATDILKQIDSALAAQEQPAPAPEPAPKPEAKAEPKPEPKPEAAPAPAAPEPMAAAPAQPPEEPAMTDESLVSEKAASAAAASMKELAAKRAKPAAPKVGAPSFRDGSTVEDLAVEALKPMLKEWLDANLPSLVEKIIQREVRRIADKSGE